MRLLGALMLEMILVAAAFQSGWQVSEKPDPMNDQMRVVARLRGDNADMVFVCGGGRPPALRYSSDEFLGGRGGHRAGRDFTYRFDAAQPVPDRWWYFDSFAEPQNTKTTVAFVTKMIQSSKLAIRALRYDGYYVDSTFDLTGSPQAFDQAFRACGIR
jgi:hypothetical protein